MTTIEIRDRCLFKAVINVGYKVLSKHAWMQDNKARVKRLEDLAEDLRRQLNRPQEDVRGPLRRRLPQGMRRHESMPTGVDPCY